MRSSAKFFSILLALAIVFSVVPVTGALADGNGFAPSNLTWDDTTLKWNAPDPMPTLKDMKMEDGTDISFTLFCDALQYSSRK